MNENLHYSRTSHSMNSTETIGITLIAIHSFSEHLSLQLLMYGTLIYYSYRNRNLIDAKRDELTKEIITETSQMINVV